MTAASGPLGRLVGLIDRLNGGIGRLVSWLAFAMIAVGAYNAIVRYLGRFTGWNLSSNAYLELQWYMFSLLFLFGGAYALQQGDHVRVDVLYSQLGRKKQLWIEFLGSLVFLVPFAIFGFYVSIPAVQNSWAILETSSDPGGLPRYPIKTAIPIAFVLLFLQGLAEAGRAWIEIRTGVRIAPPAPQATADGADESEGEVSRESDADAGKETP